MSEQSTVVRAGDGRAFMDGARVLVESGIADYSLFEQVVPANPQGVPLHRHNSHDEGFFVLEGTVSFAVGEEEIDAGAGTFVHVRRGIAHRFANRESRPARMLVVGSSQVQALVEELAPLVQRVPPDLEAVVKAFARYDSELVL